jgi:hypothetical protein
LVKIGEKAERLKAYKRQYYLKNKEKYILKAKAWTKSHPERRKEISKKDNKKRAGLKREWKEKTTFDGNATLKGKVCYLCGSNYRLGIHHKDGNNGKRGKTMNNEPNNLVVLCCRCHPVVHGQWGFKEII